MPSDRARPGVLAAVALGGGLGTPARYAVSRVVQGGPGGFPWATFWVNVAGSFALGLVIVALGRRSYARLFAATGFLGAFTTFSTLAVEVDLLAKDGHAGMALLYAAASVAVGLAAVAAGMGLGRRVAVGR
ncbi:MAG TPA: CrcB family protein [Acidimicrobiales bacterium]|jgi:CrcB protein|nr:CrcB family protein [Acidimicrobiales bacterium]